MKTQNSINQFKVPLTIHQRKSIGVYEDDLQLKAWIKNGHAKGYYTIVAQSPLIKENIHAVIQNKELIIQAAIKVEVEKQYMVNSFNNNQYIILKSDYAIIKSSRIRLPGDYNYNLISYNIVSEGLLLIKVKRWEHNL